MSARGTGSVRVREVTAEDAGELARMRWEHCFELGGYPGAGGDGIGR